MLIDSLPLPPEVRRLAIPYDIGWPDEAELTEIVRDTFQERSAAAFASSNRG